MFMYKEKNQPCNFGCGMGAAMGLETNNVNSRRGIPLFIFLNV
jgi:hypothetical protein